VEYACSKNGLGEIFRPFLLFLHAQKGADDPSTFTFIAVLVFQGDGILRMTEYK
jgi:hypothetical protein